MYVYVCSQSVLQAHGTHVEATRWVISCFACAGLMLLPVPALKSCYISISIRPSQPPPEPRMYEDDDGMVRGKRPSIFATPNEVWLMERAFSTLLTFLSRI